MPNLMNIANAEAQDAIVTFGRDMSVAESTTMTITENGTYDVRKKATVIVEVEGNPNYKEVLTGKANKLEIAAETLAEMRTGAANADIIIHSEDAIGADINGPISLLIGDDYSLTAYVTMLNVGYDVEWSTADGTCTVAKVLMFGETQDISSMMSTLDYTLTVYHHPMPEPEEP